MVQIDLTSAPSPGLEQKLWKLDALLSEEALVVAVMGWEELTVVTAGEDVVIAAPGWGPAAE